MSGVTVILTQILSGYTTKGALTTNLTQLALGITVPLDFGDARQEGWHHHEHDTHDKY